MKVVILASGGDGPGMNACIHYLTKFLHKKHEVYGCLYGFQGLIEGKFTRITPKETKEHRYKAGVFIKSSRCPEFKTREGLNKAVQTIITNQIDMVVVIGGEGSYKGAKALKEEGIRVIFIPGTIDRDLIYDSYTIGFYTAVSACAHYISNVKPTMEAFDRTCVYEVMGRDNPSLAKMVGEIVQADMVVTVENVKRFNYERFIKMHKENPVRTIILQEKLVPIEEFVKKLADACGGGVRQCVIGYVQRGTPPIKMELKLCKIFAKLAAKAINNNMFGVATCINEQKTTVIEIV